jgi:hypothetical protein
MAENKITPMRTTSAQIDLVAELRIQNRQLRQIVADLPLERTKARRGGVAASGVIFVPNECYWRL